MRLQDLRDLHASACRDSPTPLSRAVLDMLEVTLRVSSEDRQRIPPFGPLILVANHAFGILDGLVLDALLCELRDDVKILANSLVADIGGMSERCIPVDVFSPATSSANLGAVRRAKKWLREGHAITIFPPAKFRIGDRENAA